MMLRKLGLFLLASTALITSAEPAAAGPAAAIAGTVIGWLQVHAVVASLIKLGVGLALSFISKKILEKRRADEAAGVSGRMFSGGTVPRSFVMGRFPAEMSLVYANSWGTAGKTPNAYISFVIALSDLPVSGCPELWVNGEKTTWDQTDPADGQMGIPVPEYEVDGTNYMWVNFYDGTQAAADPLLVSKFNGDADRPYKADRIGRGVAYAVVTCRVNDKLFSGFPQLLFILDGIPLYDVRGDGSAGGAGTQRWDDASTWDDADGPTNPAVAIYNIIRGIRYTLPSPYEWTFGGQTIGALSLPYTSWAAAMAECDVTVDKVGGTETQFEAGITVRFDDEPAEVIERLLAACNGRLAEIGSGFKIRVGAPPASVFSFTDDDTLINKPQEFDPFPSLAAAVNGIAAQYLSTEEGWTLADAPQLLRSDLEAEDDGRRQLANIAFDTVLSVTQVQRLQSAILNEERAFRQHGLPLPPDAFLLEPLDTVVWTSTRNGYVNKAFEVLEVMDYSNLDIDVGIKELDPNAYDWTPGTDEVLVSFFPPTRILPASQAISGWSVSGVLVEGDSGQRRPGVELTWAADVDDVIGIRFQIRLAADQSLVIDGTTANWEDGTAVITQSLLSITSYEARGIYIPGSQRTTEWSAWLPFTTPDARITEDMVVAAIAARLQQIEEQIPVDLATLREDLNVISGALAAQTATIQEQLGWLRTGVGSRYGENLAGIEQNALAITGINSAIAEFFVDLFAISEAGEATTSFRMIAGSLPEGAVGQVQFQAKAGIGGEAAEASLSLVAYYDTTLDMYYSRIVMEAQYVDIVVNGVVLPAYQFGVADRPYEIPIVSGSITPNLSSRRLVYHTLLTADASVELPVGAQPGFEWRHIFEQNGTGGWDLTWDANYLGDDPVISVLPETVSIVDCLVIDIDGDGNPLIIHTLRKTAALDGGPLSTAGEEIYSVAGAFTFTVPVFTTLTIEMWGGGGGGGGSALYSTARGGTGGDTTIAALSLTAAGGQGGEGTRMSSNPPRGGTDGSSTAVGGTIDDGEHGTNGSEDSFNLASPQGAGGDGGGADGGAGGASVASYGGDKEGNPGAAPGGGGSGAINYFKAVGGGGAGGDKVTKTYNFGDIATGTVLDLVVGAGGTRGVGNIQGGLGAVGRIKFTWT